MKVCTCQSKKSPPSTTAAVKSATATVRITCEGAKRTHTVPALPSMGMTGSTSSAREVLCLPLPSTICLLLPAPSKGVLGFSAPVCGMLCSLASSLCSPVSSICLPVSSLPSLISLPQLPLVQEVHYKHLLQPGTHLS